MFLLPPAMPRQLIPGDGLPDSPSAGARNSSSHEFPSLGVHKEVDIPFVPLKKTAGELGHEGLVERVGLSGAPPCQPPHKMPDV